jgi:hypothetical protein
MIATMQQGQFPLTDHQGKSCRYFFSGVNCHNLSAWLPGMGVVPPQQE